LGNRAETLRVNGRYAEAIEVLKSSLELSKDNFNLLTQLNAVNGLKQQMEDMRAQMTWTTTLKHTLIGLLSDPAPQNGQSLPPLEPQKRKLFEDCISMVEQGSWSKNKQHLTEELQRAMLEESNKMYQQRLAAMAPVVKTWKDVDPNRNWPPRQEAPKTGRVAMDAYLAKQKKMEQQMGDESGRQYEIRVLERLRDEFKAASQAHFPYGHPVTEVPESEKGYVK